MMIDAVTLRFSDIFLGGERFKIHLPHENKGLSL